MLHKWLQPGKVPFLVITIFLLVMAVVSFIQGSIPVVASGFLALFGLLALRVHIKAKKEKNKQSTTD